MMYHSLVKINFMQVIKAYNFLRNDCTMDEECEWCGFVYIDRYAYNDEYYRTHVVPDRCCSKCGKNSKGQTHEDKLRETFPDRYPSPIPTNELDKSLDTIERLQKEFKHENNS